MNTMTRLLLSFLFFAFANISFSQVAEDFEFIDHKARIAYHGVSKVMEDGFLYVGHNGNPGPMTSVIKVNTFDNSVDTIFTTYNSQSRIQEYPDGTFEILLYSLFDYDVGVPGFVSIEYDGSELNTKPFTPYDNEALIWDDYYYTTSVVKGENDTYYMSSFNDTYIFRSDSTSQILPLEKLDLDFHKNSDRKIFAYEQSNLYEFSETALIPILEFESQILDIENNGDFNDVLFKGGLQRWTSDFEQKVYEWVLPEEIVNFYQLKVDTVSVTGLVKDGNRFMISKYNLDGIGTLIYEDEMDDEAIVGFHQIDESKMLLIGSDSIPEIEYHTNFFRHVDFNNEIEYQSRNVSIDSLVLFQSKKEDVFQYVNSSTGDSIFATFFTTELTLTFTNRSDEIVDDLNCRSSLLAQWWYFFPTDYAFDDLVLMPGESFTIEEELYRSSSAENLIFGIPGADFRFNNDPNKVAYPDFTADFENVAFDLNLKLFPNPSSELLNISIDQKVQAIEIYNPQGQLMMYKSIGSDLGQVDVSRLPAGTYYVRLRLADNKGFASQQFVKSSD